MSHPSEWDLHGKIEGTKGFFGGKRFTATLYAVDPDLNINLHLWSHDFRSLEKAEAHLDEQAAWWSESMSKPEVIITKEYPRAEAV